jgi:hypothetical protein
MFEELVKWHLEYRPEDIVESQIQEELNTGSFFINGKDKMGRPILVLYGARLDPDTRDLARTVRALLYWMVKGIKMMGPGVEQFTVIYDREGVTRKNFDLPLVKEWAQIQNYYPLRLGLAFVLQPNWLFQMSYKICSVFISEESHRKIQLTTKNWKQELQAVIPRDQLLVGHGGTVEIPYDYLLAVRKGISPLSETEIELHEKLEEARAGGDVELQAAILQEQLEAWINDINGDNSSAAKVLRSFVSNSATR